MLSIRVAALAACAAALSPTPTATPRQRLRTRRYFGGFKLPNIENPFDDRPGATVGKLQIALANEDMSATRVVADCAARFAHANRTDAEGHAYAFDSGDCAGIRKRYGYAGAFERAKITPELAAEPS